MIRYLLYKNRIFGTLEVYSDLKGDISNKPYEDFMMQNTEIIRKSCGVLKRGWYACLVVGEYRAKKVNYIGFVPDTINALKACGLKFYSEAIFITGSPIAMLIAGLYMKTKKLVRRHQNILVFKK